MKVAPHLHQEKARLESLKSYDLMDTDQDHEYDELTELAAEICETPIALITLIDEKRQWFKSKYGTAVCETDRDIAFCAHTIQQQNDIMIVPDARQDVRFYNNPMVVGTNGVIFYAGVPLINAQGYALGSICVLAHEEKELSALQIKTLKVLAKQVVTRMELCRKLQEVQSSKQALSESYTFIEKFAERAAHDIKNPLSNIILTAQALKSMLSKLGDERSMRLIDITLAAGKSLTGYINELLRYSKSPSLLQVQHEEFELLHVLKKALSLIDVPDKCTVHLPVNPVHIYASRIALEQIFLNLLSNAVRYNDKSDPVIRILFRADDHYYHFDVKDNGKGISSADQLKIFEHGFVSNQQDCYNKKGSGIGMNIVKSLVDKLNGSILISSEVGVGTTFHVSVPRQMPAS